MLVPPPPLSDDARDCSRLEDVIYITKRDEEP